MIVRSIEHKLQQCWLGSHRCDVKRAHSAEIVTSFFFLSLYDFLNPMTERFSVRGFSISACGQVLSAGRNPYRRQHLQREKCAEL